MRNGAARMLLCSSPVLVRNSTPPSSSASFFSNSVWCWDGRANRNRDNPERQVFKRERADARRNCRDESWAKQPPFPNSLALFFFCPFLSCLVNRKGRGETKLKKWIKVAPLLSFRTPGGEPCFESILRPKKASTVNLKS